MGARLALAFSAGMVATVNPCGFALLPAYLTYFLGLDPAGSDATTDSADARRANPSPVLRALVVSAAVTAGFLVVFGVMGLAWSSVSSVIGRRLPWFTLVIGIGLVARVRNQRGIPRTGMPLRFTSSWNMSECWDSSMISWCR